MKFLRAGQVAEVVFGRLNSTVRLRLRRLFDGGFVKAWMPSLNEENVWSIDRKGLLVLDDGTPDGSVPRRLDRRLRHLLCINDVRIALSLAVSAEGGEVIEWKSDWQMKRPGARGLVPDALFTLRVRQQELTFALEVDLGGEPAPTVFAEKLQSYRSRPETLLVVVPTIRRLVTLLDVAAKEPDTADFLFTLREKITPVSILGPIWTSPRLMLAEPTAAFVSLCDLFEQEGGALNG
jgi:hypothetical protein